MPRKATGRPIGRPESSPTSINNPRLGLILKAFQIARVALLPLKPWTLARLAVGDPKTKDDANLIRALATDLGEIIRSAKRDRAKGNTLKDEEQPRRVSGFAVGGLFFEETPRPVTGVLIGLCFIEDKT
jgi:hypothetical protein